MKLIMELPLAFDEAKKIYPTGSITQLRDTVRIEINCSLEEAIAFINLDTSVGDKSIALRRG